jgi:2-polyprenyl-6-methoxyphenol hydroxylase-like FAD-dependent oxidoreductase
MIEHAVVIAGGGPTGMMLAGELALAGVDVAIVERRATAELLGSRAGGLHARTIEVLDQRGIADRFLTEGRTMQAAGFAHITLDISDLPTRHSYVLALWQKHFERILAGWIKELAIPVYRECDVTGFAQDDTDVDVHLSNGQPLRAEYLVGCDGGRSVVRKAAGIAFPGWEPTISHLLAEVELAEEPEWGMRHDTAGLHALSRIDDRLVRVLVTEEQPGRISEPTLGDLSEELIRVDGTDYGVHSPVWITRFTDAARQAETYRKGRILLAGDAAHIHYPAGGQGLNLGVQDAVNLGWKLAQVIKRTSPESLLDSYHAERHPVAAAVLKNSLAQVALMRRDERSKAAWQIVSELLKMDEPRKQYGAMVSGLDIQYDIPCHSGEKHPLLGRRMPDLDLITANGPVRVFSLLRDARPVFLNLAEPRTVDITPWADRVQLIDASYAGPWELPALGAVTPPTALLIRPDGYVAWVDDQTRSSPTDAITTWFGPPAAA